ncbi:MAG: flagellar motor switch protein FliN [Solirubrobacteraceae bacterium]|nr:flagellar motor switch protein FliN [Solirubrobacteraceae bacterium]
MLDSPELHTASAAPVADLERLVGVRVEVAVELGRTKMTLGEALEIGPGAVIPLGRTAGAPLDLLVNGQLVARGEVLVVDDVYGLQITEVIEATTPVVHNAAPALSGQAPLEQQLAA